MEQETKKLNLTRLFITLGIVLITALAIGGSTYYVMSSNASKEKEATDKQISEMQKQLNDLQKVQEKKPDTTTNNNTQITSTVAPGTVVSNFLTGYINYVKTHSNGGAQGYLGETQNTPVTTTFKTSVIEGLHNADPILLAQDFPDNGFTIGSVTTDGSNSTVPVTLNFSGGPSRIVYSLVLANNEWRINSVKK